MATDITADHAIWDIFTESFSRELIEQMKELPMSTDSVFTHLHKILVQHPNIQRASIPAPINQESDVSNKCALT